MKVNDWFRPMGNVGFDMEAYSFILEYEASTRDWWNDRMNEAIEREKKLWEECSLPE